MDPDAIDLTDDGQAPGRDPARLLPRAQHDRAARGLPAPARAQALLHIVLSHHGVLENGSPVVPATREATLVHMIDNLGGRLGSFDRLEKGLQDGETWSPYDRALDGLRPTSRPGPTRPRRPCSPPPRASRPLRHSGRRRLDGCTSHMDRLLCDVARLAPMDLGGGSTCHRADRKSHRVGILLVAILAGMSVRAGRDPATASRSPTGTGRTGSSARSWRSAAAIAAAGAIRLIESRGHIAEPRGAPRRWPTPRGSSAAAATPSRS